MSLDLLVGYPVGLVLFQTMLFPKRYSFCSYEVSLNQAIGVACHNAQECLNFKYTAFYQKKKKRKKKKKEKVGI